MKLYLDRNAVDRARFINKLEHGDIRRYYLLSHQVEGILTDAILVARNDYDLNKLAGAVVDAQIGWDTAQPGFCHEKDVGKRRTKITIHRPLHTQRPHAALSYVLSNIPQKGQR